MPVSPTAHPRAAHWQIHVTDDKDTRSSPQSGTGASAWRQREHKLFSSRGAGAPGKHAVREPELPVNQHQAAVRSRVKSTPSAGTEHTLHLQVHNLGGWNPTLKNTCFKEFK